ncbi:MAG: PBECR4 domain-containing protein [Lachnospiraceae bacterium]
MITYESFKERVRSIAIVSASKYKSVYIDFDYLLCSPAFHQRKYYEITATKGNYKHLVGVHSELSGDEFFDKCLEGTLELDDFDFYKKGQIEKEVKGSVRQKIQVLPIMLEMLSKVVYAEESFKKNKIHCAFATEGNAVTVGYVLAGKPMTLLKGNELDKRKALPVELILRKKKNEMKYHQIIQGDNLMIGKYITNIEGVIEVNRLPNRKDC